MPPYIKLFIGISHKPYLSFCPCIPQKVAVDATQI